MGHKREALPLLTVGASASPLLMGTQQNVLRHFPHYFQVQALKCKCKYLSLHVPSSFSSLGKVLKAMFKKMGQKHFGIRLMFQTWVIPHYHDYPAV